MMKLYRPRKYEAKKQENATESQAESIPIVCTRITYAKTRGNQAKILSGLQTGSDTD